MIRALITLVLLGIALLVAAVGVGGAAFMFSHPGPGPVVIGIIFAGALLLFAVAIVFGALAVSFSPSDDAGEADDEPAARPELCIMCKYDLSALPRRGVCPECGFSYDLDDRAATFAD